MLNYSLDLTASNSFSNISLEPTIAEVRHVGISGDGQIIVAVFIIIVLVLIFFNLNKEKYSKWVNPNGRTVNLIKIMRIILYAYTALVIVSLLVAKYLLGV